MKTPLFLCLALSAISLSGAENKFAAEKKEDRLIITSGGKPLADFVFKDPEIQRPFFANVKTLAGIQVTRTHPPVEGKDPADHADMHPGIWLAFSDISGHDFWRNKASIRHERFTQEPVFKDGALTFTTLSKMVPAGGPALAEMTSTITIAYEWDGWMLLWDATFTPLVDGFSFGDQEEMGLGVRVATPLTEKQGGVILSSTGSKSAKNTWGRHADWCDYSGAVEGKPCGVQLLSSPDNFRQSWFHNRDYGLMVANHFGYKTFNPVGKPERIAVEKNKPLRLRYGVMVHDGFEFGVERYTEEKWHHYVGISRRAEKLEEARRIIASLRGGPGVQPAAGELKTWDLSLGTFEDRIPTGTLISLYSETCQKLKQLYGNDLQTLATGPGEWPGLYTAVQIKGDDGKIRQHLLVWVTQGNDSASYHFALKKGPWEPGASAKLKPQSSWEMPKDYLGKDSE